MIFRHNCEAFFLDYYEGNLSEGQVAEMFAFLKANPDMREVFEAFSDVTLDANDTNTPDFSFLKKESEVNVHELAQQWMVDFVDGTISAEDKISLENYLNENPSKRAELTAFEETILRADENETLGDLSAFKKNVAITPENFEYYAIALIEGTISENEKSLLESFVLTHPEFSIELDAFRASIQEADESIVFDAKSSLKKSAVVVTKDNIEELLVEKTEGLLSAHDEAAVDAFVVAYPECKRDLELLGKTKLVADANETFDAKNKLKRGAILINESNFEQYLISATEGLLNGEEQAAFNAFVAANPQHKKAVALYGATKLQPDMSVVYDDKAGLKRKEKGAIIWFSVGFRYAAAAVLVIMLSVYFWTKYDNTNPGEVQVADGMQQNTNKNNGNEVVPSNNEQITPSDNNVVASTNSNNSNDVQNPFVRKNDGNSVVKKNDVNPQPENILVASFTPVTIIASSLPNEVQESVTFSDALYAVVYENNNQTLKVEPADEYISPGQFAMRWMKNKIDGNDPVPSYQQNDMQGFAAKNQKPQDKNVDGLDITESAVNRVGQSAANGNVAMEQRNDGTYLQLWNYEVRVAN